MRIVSKTWGMEIWFVNNEHYCGKRLIFAEDHRCSVHWHKEKHETFLVDRGRVVVETFKMTIPVITKDASASVSMMLPEMAYILEVGQTMEIPQGIPHRITAIGGNASIIEFSTHHEDSDSYRGQTGQVWD